MIVPCRVTRLLTTPTEADWLGAQFVDAVGNTLPVSMGYAKAAHFMGGEKAFCASKLWAGHT